MSDRTPQKPVERVEAELRARVESGEWQKDEQLPGINTLAREHKTSRATMNRVVNKLGREGLLNVVQGWGTFRA